MSAEDKLREEVNNCRNCEACETLLNSSCLVFPEMFRLVDDERETGKEMGTNQLRHLVNQCNFCGLCPCTRIRAAIINAKTEYMEKYGLGFKTRVIENMERLGKMGGGIPKLSNFLLQNEVSRSLIERTMGIHRERSIPYFPKENFPQWMKNHKADTRVRTKQKKKVAYFAGCTGRYLFPEVPKAVIEVFEKNDIEVYYPEQQCCGMPCLLEGDKRLTLEFAEFNVTHLANAVEQGYDIVCSCPTCGYMLKNVLKAGAYFSSEYLESAVSGDGFVKMPMRHSLIFPISGDYIKVRRTLIEGILSDEGYFSSISPQKRIMISENVYDVGEYLREMHKSGEFDTRLGPISARAAYYPPCHLREQRIGRPYGYLLRLVPGLSLDMVSGIYCCGNGGIMGLKREFHHTSIKIAGRLMAEIKGLRPEVLVTDCLSCRIQFNQLTPYKQLHPIQIIKESYNQYEKNGAKKAV